MATNDPLAARSVTSATPNGDAGTVLAVPQPGQIWAKITGNASGTNRYAWTQLDTGDTPAFDTGLSEEFAATGTSAVGGAPAYEINGRTDVATGTRVLLYPAGDLTYYIFDGTAGGPGGGTGGCSGCGWVAGLTDLDCLLATVVERLGRCACATVCVDTDTGAQFPGTVTGMGDMPDTWAFTERLTALDGDQAICELPAGAQSETLSLTDFGISVPDGATIKGIKIEVLGKSEGEGGRHVLDYLVQVNYPGGFVALGPDTTVWPDSSTLDTTYGGPTSLLGRDPGEWTPAQANALDVRFRAYNDPEFTEGTAQARIDAFRVTVYYCTTGESPATNDGPVYLTSEDGEDWTATGDGTTITICGVEYALTFSREGCDGPCLTLTSDGGTAYTAVRDCCGPNYAIFSIGIPAVCSGTTDAAAGPAGNVARIKVEWTCCPAEGYAGPGYYCVRDVGSDEPCAAVEVLSASDVCASEVEICGGPFETIEEAQAECPDFSGPDIVLSCEGEPARSIPRVIYAKLTNVVGFPSGGGAHPEWEGLVIPLVYGPLPGATGSEPVEFEGWHGCADGGGGCFVNMYAYVTCPGGIGIGLHGYETCVRETTSGLGYTLEPDGNLLLAVTGYGIDYYCPSYGVDAVADITITKSAP